MLILELLQNLQKSLTITDFFLHFGTPTTEVGVVRLSNSAANKAAVGTTERELFRETLTIPSPTVEEEDEALFYIIYIINFTNSTTINIGTRAIAIKSDILNT